MKFQIPKSIRGSDGKIVDGKAAYDEIMAMKEEEKPVMSKASQPEEQDGFIYVPSINLWVAKQRTHLNEDWFECHKLLQTKGEKMLTLPEFIEFLKYTRETFPDIYEEITEVRSSLSAEWLDADFKVGERGLHINYHHILDSQGNLIPKNSEPLDKNTLMNDKQISLDDYLNNNTSQGLPTKKVNSGEWNYWYPRSDDISATWFDAGSVRVALYCDRDPSSWSPWLGVRAVRQKI